MAEQLEAAVEETEEPSAMDKVLDDIDQRESGSEIQEEPADQKDQEAPEPQPSQSVSAAMLAVARQVGIGDQFIQLAKDDEQLGEMIEMARNYKPEPEESAQGPPEPFKVELPDDEYGEKDPVRVALNQVVEHYEKELNQVRKGIAESYHELKNLREQADQSEGRRLEEFNVLFHRGLDELSDEVLGDSTKKLNDNHHSIRKAVYERAAEMHQQGHPGNADELARKVASEMFPFLGKQPQRQAARSQRKRSLGSNGNSTPPDVGSSPDQRFEVKLEEILAKRR